MEAAQFNKQMYEQNSTAYSLDGARSILEEYNSARAILDEIKAKQRTAGQPKNAAAAQPNNQASPAQQSVSNTTYLVKLDFGTGRTQDVSVASANDAQTLISALQNAKRAAGG